MCAEGKGRLEYRRGRVRVGGGLDWMYSRIKQAKDKLSHRVLLIYRRVKIATGKGRVKG